MALSSLVGEWGLAVDLPGAQDSLGRMVIEHLGSLLLQRTTIPDPNVPDSVCLIAAQPDGTFLQHYFDSRGVARLYTMTFDGITWTLLRTTPDVTPLDFHQRSSGGSATTDPPTTGSGRRQVTAWTGGATSASPTDGSALEAIVNRIGQPADQYGSRCSV